MNLSERAKEVLEGLDQERGVDFYPLQEENHPLPVLQTSDAIRRFLQLPSTSGGLRPDSEYLAVLLGFGKAGLLKIFERFCSVTARTDDESRVALGALATLARRARGMRLIGWDIDGVTLDATKGAP